tara:strand:+ start:181 stop:828 length:648 start_codon:yes stop_codon:yes gene_type:complete
MLIPLRPGELHRVIPAVATGNQFKSALGNPQKILQRVLISAIGGGITLVISQTQVTSQFYAVWLLLGVILILYILWGPIYEASRQNSKLRDFNISALFQGTILDLYTKEYIENRHEQANKLGELELVENRRLWLIIELEDEDGFLSKLSFPMEKKHQLIRKGMIVRCLVFSNRKDFNRIESLSDAWLPEITQWVGDYPFLLRPAFEELCNIRLPR